MTELKYNLSEGKRAGTYRATLLKVSKETSMTGHPTLVFKWRMTSGANEGLTINSYASLRNGWLASLKEHLEAFGEHGLVDIDTDDLVGRQAELTLVDRKPIKHGWYDYVGVARVRPSG